MGNNNIKKDYVERDGIGDMRNVVNVINVTNINNKVMNINSKTLLIKNKNFKYN